MWNINIHSLNFAGNFNGTVSTMDNLNSKLKLEKLVFLNIVAEVYQCELRNRFRALAHQPEESVEETWRGLRDTWKATCNKVLGKKTRQHKEWLSRSTGPILGVEPTDQEKHQSGQEELHTRPLRRSRNSSWQKRYEEAVWYHKNTAREEEGPFKTSERQKRRDHHRWSQTESKMGRHFQEILNRPPPQVPGDIPPAANQLAVSIYPPTKAEVSKAIKSFKSGKAAGPDGIPPEAQNADIQTSTEIIHPLLVKIWENEQIPDDWKKEYLVKLPKKGDLSSCNNWRGIMLLSIPSKILTRIILVTQECPWQNSTRGAGRFTPRQILHRPHRHTANYHRAVAGMADPTVLSIRRLPKGIRQCGSRHRLKAHATLRLSPQVHFHHTATVRQLQLPSHTRREVDGHIPGTDRSSSRLLTVADHLPSGSRLDYEADNIRQKDRHPVDFHQTVGRPGLRWRLQSPITQTPGCTGEAVPPRRQICPGLTANEMHAPHNRRHKVSSLKHFHQKAHNSVLYEEVWKCQITQPYMKFQPNNTCVQSWT